MFPGGVKRSDALRLLPAEYGVRNLGRSPVRLALVSGGALLIVLVVIVAAGFVRGMERVIGQTAGADNVILLGAGSEESIERSEISPASASQLAASVPGIKTRAGQTFASPEVFMQMVLKTDRDSPRDYRVAMRGVTPAAFLVHRRVRIAEGRHAENGADELVVGRMAAARMGLPEERLAIGQKLWLDSRPWTIVGHLAAPGSVLESEIWLPLTDLQIAAKRDSLSAVVATLDEAEFADVDFFCKERLDLELVAMPEAEYYESLKAFYQPVRLMVWFTAGLIVIGGVLGGLNVMYAAFAARVRELGTLQSLGFSRAAIVISMVQESVLATSFGALLATAIGLVFLDRLAVRFSSGAYGLALDGPTVAIALGVGLALGVIGALPPAWRCLRLPIPEALKAA